MRPPTLSSPPLWLNPSITGHSGSALEQGRSGGGGGGWGRESGVKRPPLFSLCEKRGGWPPFLFSSNLWFLSQNRLNYLQNRVAENSHTTTAIDQNDSLIFLNKTRQDQGCVALFTLTAQYRLYHYDVCAENRVCYWIHGTFLHYLCRRVRLIGAALHEPWNGGVHALLSTGCALGQKSFKYSVH